MFAIACCCGLEPGDAVVCLFVAGVIRCVPSSFVVSCIVFVFVVVLKDVRCLLFVVCRLFRWCCLLFMLFVVCRRRCSCVVVCCCYVFVVVVDVGAVCCLLLFVA